MKRSPLYDTSLSVEERAKWIVSQMTIEEKLSCFAGHPAVERLGLTEYRFGGEGAHGLQARAGQHEPYPPTPSTSFTQPIGMAASWDTDLIREAGNVTGTEARALYNEYGRGIGVTRFAPTVDLCRDPRWGRNEEGYGEDPLLTGKMAGAYLEGMQDEHNYDGSPVEKGQRGDRIRIGSDLKHFYANNMEWRRCYDSVDVSDKVKYDYEMEPYRYCIQDSHAEGVMTAYNAINHVTGMLNHEVQDILKNEWGMVHAITDGGAFQQVVNFHHDFESHAETFAEAVRAGLDHMLDDPGAVGKAAREAWERGLIREEELDRSLVCMFSTRIRLGAFDENDPYEKLSLRDIGTEWAADISKRMAKASNVLLKNEDHFLPFDPEDDIVLIGPCGDTWFMDWYAGKPMHRTTLKQGIEQETGKAVRFENGLDQIRLKAEGRYVGAGEGENPRLILVDEVEKAVIFEHTDWGWGCNFLYSPAHQKYVNFNENGELRLESDEPFKWFVMESLTIIPAEGATRQEDPHNANMIEFDRYWDDRPGEVKIYGFGARPVAIKDGILMGDELSMVKNMEGNREGKNMAENYDNGLSEAAVFSVEIVKDGIEEAKKLAGTAEKVILALGCDPVINAKEEVDRRSIAMIPYQERLTEEICTVNPQTAVVLMTNYPYAIGKMQKQVPAILMNATGSQDMGEGLASAIFGSSVPAGRLPMTWYRSDEDLYPMTDYDIIRHPRTYRYFDKPVLYPFGYGLSYTTFAYESVSAEPAEEGGLTLTVRIKNTGAVASDEVVQVYSKRSSESETVHPLRRLIAFMRTRAVQPGETRVITLNAAKEDLAVYMEKEKKRVVEKGTYFVYAGAHALDEAVGCCIEL